MSPFAPAVRRFSDLQLDSGNVKHRLRNAAFSVPFYTSSRELKFLKLWEQTHSAIHITFDEI